MKLIETWLGRWIVEDWRNWKKRYSTLSLAFGSVLSAIAVAASLAAPAAALVTIFTVRIVLLLVLVIFVCGFVGGLLKQPKLHEPDDNDDPDTFGV